MKSLLPILAAGFFASTVLSADTTSPKDSAPAPRYKLQPGQELVYEGSSEFKHENGSHLTTEKITYWVTRANENGGWHLAGYRESTFTQVFGGNSPPQVPPRKEEVIGTFDLSPDGRIEHLPDDFRSAALKTAFIELPADLATATKGWERSDEPPQKLIFHLAPESEPASGKWIFSQTEEGLFNTIYVSTSNSLIRFDASRGLITSTEGNYTQDYGFHGKGTSKLELKSVATKPREWIDQLAQEADILTRAKKATRDLAGGPGKKTGNFQEAARALLEESRAKVKLPLVVAQFDADLKNLADTARYLTEDQQREEAVLNKPAADWETTDLAGHKQRLADYRGKVVLMDFWYRGCGWCIRAMPQIKEVADHYRDKPVIVLGMNTDSDDKDAQFVIDKLQLNYPTLKAKGLPEKYGVQGFPTLIVVDPAGVVRAWHVGYSANLRDELIKTVDGLLPAEK